MLYSPIIPKVLRDLMTEKNLSSVALASATGVATKTISRLLNPPEGRGKRPPRQHTVQSIARVLETTPEVLCGKVLKDTQTRRTLADGAYDEVVLNTQLNVRVDHETRNAMTLICRRYDVKPHQVVMLAPLLFHCVAELSLKRRRIRLDELEAKQKEIGALQHNFGHLHGCLCFNPNGDEIFFTEKESVEKGNIFADDILAEEGFNGPASAEFYSDQKNMNPFSKFVSDFVSEASENVKFEGFDRSSYGACYTLNESFALKYVKGDRDVAQGIVNGVVGIHEIPTEMRDTESRFQWLKKTIEDRKLEAEKFFEEMIKIINEDAHVEAHEEKKDE